MEEATVLLVDDDPDVLRAYARVLRSAGYSVLEALAAGECLSLARGRRPEVILLDAELPDGSGFEVCQQIKADAELSDVMVLIISGVYTTAEHQAEGAGAGADGYLTKPVPPRALLTYVRALMRLREARQESARLLRSLEAERSRLSYLFTHSPAFVAVLRGPRHVFELANPSYLDLIGNRDVLGMSVREALPELEGQGFFELLDGVFETGEPHVGRETRILVRRGEGKPPEELFVNFVYQPLFGDGGEVTGIFAHGVDVTPQVKARREAEVANRLKDEFLATVSHELRTPLTAILGWSSMLSSGELDDATRERALRVIERNAQAQAQLINDLLDVSRIITGKLRLDARPVELAQVVAQAVESARPAASAKGVALRAEYDPEAGPVSGDPARLQQVVWNLLTNAVKFTPEGGRVEVRLALAEPYAEITVSDTGEGISGELLPYVFERFRQAGGSRSRTNGGLGLGLAIVRQLVELHGGVVGAESAGVGLGAKFTVRLPLANAPANRAVHARDAAGTNAVSFDDLPRLDGLHVLAVDDEDDVREFIASALGRSGARVSAVGSAAEALAAVARERPDVLVCDIGLPDQDGYELIRRVRALGEGRGGGVPAAALTAYAGEEDRIRALVAGYQAHVQKPINPTELVALVASLANRTGGG